MSNKLSDEGLIFGTSGKLSSVFGNLILLGSDITYENSTRVTVDRGSVNENGIAYSTLPLLKVGESASIGEASTDEYFVIPEGTYILRHIESNMNLSDLSSLTIEKGIHNLEDEEEGVVTEGYSYRAGNALGLMAYAVYFRIS